MQTLFPQAFVKNDSISVMCPKEKCVRAAMAESKSKKGAIYSRGRNMWSTIKKKVYRMALSGRFTKV